MAEKLTQAQRVEKEQRFKALELENAEIGSDLALLEKVDAAEKTNVKLKKRRDALDGPGGD